MLYCLRKALRSLQNVSGIYGMVVPSAAVSFPGQIVGNFVGRTITQNATYILAPCTFCVITISSTPSVHYNYTIA